MSIGGRSRSAPGPAPEETGGLQAGLAHRAARRSANARKCSSPEPETDAQGLVELACECVKTDCERSVKVPLYVYRRIAEAGNQCLVQSGHHAFARYRTIVTQGLIRIEERF